MADDVPLHPLAAKVLDRVEVQADGARSAIPEATLANVHQKLAQHLDDRLLFVHLVVLHARLKRGGLATAAAQLLELARLGLGARLEETLERVQTSKEAEKTYRASVAGRKPTAGLAPAGPLSVGLRPGPRKP